MEHRRRNSGPGDPDFAYRNKPSLQEGNWNGLSPRNKDNKERYQHVQNSQQSCNNGEWSESEVDPLITRKRLASPSSASDHPAKRIMGLREPFDDQHRMEPPSDLYGSFQRYPSKEYRLPPIPMNTPRKSSWVGPEIYDIERWRSDAGGGFEQISSRLTPHQYTNHNQYADTHEKDARSPFGQGNGANLRAQSLYPNDRRLMSSRNSMSVAPKYSQSHHHRQDEMPSFSNGQQSPQGQQFVDLTTPESLSERRHAALSSTTTSSMLRRVPYTEPTDIECNYDREDHNITRLRPCVPKNQVCGDDYDLLDSRLPIQNIMPRGKNIYTSRLGQSTDDRGRKDSHSVRDFPGRESLKVSSVSRGYNGTRVSQFEPLLKSEDSFHHNSFRVPSQQPLCSNVHRQSVGSDDPESDDNDTLEETMRKKTLQKKARAAKNASRDILFKRIDFGGSRRSASEYSSQDVTAPRTREEAQEDTLSKIRGSESSKIATQSNIHETNTQLRKSDLGHYVVIQETAAQKAAALEKEDAERHRQKLAADAIVRKERQAKDLHETDSLFEELPMDEARQNRIKMAKATEKARRLAAEEAKIVQEHDKKLQEELTTIRKLHLAGEQEEYNVEKQKRLEEKRKHDIKIEEDRLNGKRKSAAGILRLNRLREEEARLEGLNKLAAEKHTSKIRASMLQSAKKTTSISNIVSNTASGKAAKSAEVTSELDDCMFVSADVITVDNSPREEQSANNNDDRQAEKPVSAHVLETVSIENVTCVQEAQAAEDSLGPQLSDEIPITQSLEDATIEVKSSMTTAHLSMSVAEPGRRAAQMPITTGDSLMTEPESSGVIGEYSATAVVPVADEAKTGANTAENATNVENSATKLAQATVPTDRSTSISDIASDGRRRSQEVPKPRAARPTSPKPISSKASGHNAPHTQGADGQTSSSLHAASSKSQKANTKSRGKDIPANSTEPVEKGQDLSSAKAEESLRNQEWTRVRQLLEVLTLQKQNNMARDNKRASFERARNIQPISASDNQQTSLVRVPKNLSLTSNIQFRSHVKSQADDKEKTRKERLAKYEKDKAKSRKRYEREIRQVLSGQGIEPDEEKVARQLEEKLIVWDQNRRRKECKDKSGKELFGSADPHDDASASDASQDHYMQPNISNTADDSVIDPVLLQEQKRMVAMRQGMNFLASQNRAGNNFAGAASKSRIEEIDSDESEEDPDNEPESQLAQQTVHTGGEAPEETVGEAVEGFLGLWNDETLDPAALDHSIIPQLPVHHRSSTAFFPDLVNPRDEDIMHSYSIRHRAGREDKVYDSVILEHFYNLEEANAFARQKVAEFSLIPGTGKTEVHNSDNLYIGRVTTDMDKDHEETVWVTREIIYIGDTTNITHGDIKAIIVPKVFNVIQVLQGEDGTHTGSVIATASIKALANKRASQQFLTLMKPSRPRLDALAEYDNVIVPTVLSKLSEAQAEDVTIDLEGSIPDTERRVSILVSENAVVGPLN